MPESPPTPGSRVEPPPFDEPDAAAARLEMARWLEAHSNAALLASCRARSKGLLPSGLRDGSAVVDALIEHLHRRSPCSLVRVGDGEGNALAFAESPGDPLAWKCFQHAFLYYDVELPSRPQALEFATQVRDAILHADLVGMRSVDDAFPTEQERVRRLTQNGRVRPAMGIVAAHAFLQKALDGGAYEASYIVSAWIYFGLLEHLDRLLAAAPKVLVVSGKTELAPEFHRRVGSRLLAFRDIPLEASSRSSDESHYFDRFAREIEFLTQDLAGTLVLVGGGLFGKIYCDHAKKHGAVAVDLGSGFDLLAGQETRPIHAQMMVAPEPWLGALARPRFRANAAPEPPTATRGAAVEDAQQSAWRIETHNGGVARLEHVPDHPARMRVAIAHLPSRVPWHVKLRLASLEIVEGSPYLLSFWAKADAPRPMACGVGQTVAPWALVSPYLNVEVTTSWTHVECPFVAHATESQARIFFDLGAAEAAVELYGVVLHNRSTGLPVTPVTLP